MNRKRVFEPKLSFSGREYILSHLFHERGFEVQRVDRKDRQHWSKLYFVYNRSRRQGAEGKLRSEELKTSDNAPFWGVRDWRPTGRQGEQGRRDAEKERIT